MTSIEPTAPLENDALHTEGVADVNDAVDGEVEANESEQDEGDDAESEAQDSEVVDWSDEEEDMHERDVDAMVVVEETSEGSDGYSSSSGEDRDRAEDRDRRSRMLSTMTFDTAITGTHSYLGETMTASRGLAPVGLLRVGDALLDLPLVSLDHIVLFPGQTLPMTLTRLSERNAIKEMLADSNARRLLLIASPTVLECSSSLRVGTTGEVRSFRDAGTALHVVVLGRQRVALQGSCAVQPSGMLTCSVLVLEDLPPPCVPLEVMGTPAPLKRGSAKKYVGGRDSSARAAGVEMEGNSEGQTYSTHPSYLDREIGKAGEDGEAEMDGKIDGPARVRAVEVEAAKGFRQGVRRWRGAGCGYWPAWCYKMFDATELRKQARARFLLLTGALEDSGEERHGEEGAMALQKQVDCTLQSPTDFSYWLSWNLMVGHRERQQFLECASTVQRLRLQLSILQRMGSMACRHCAPILLPL
jgi:hypothetical protein